MRRVGTVLLGLGLAVGIATGAAILAGVSLPGVESWLANVALAKLAFGSALALMGAGAVLQRTATRRAFTAQSPTAAENVAPGRERAALPAGEAPVVPRPAPAEPVREAAGRRPPSGEER